MLSILSVFISRPLVVILNKVLSIFELCLLIIWSDVTVREYTRRLHTSECKIKIQKITYLFITIKVQLITISSVIPYISKTNSTSNSIKKKPQEKKKEEKGNVKERKKRWKRGEEEKREEQQGERKGKRENEMGKNRRKKRRENEREGEGE